MYFLNKWILSHKKILEYFYKFFFKVNLNKPSKKRSNTSVTYVWLDSKIDFKDKFMKSRVDSHFKITDACQTREVCTYYICD